MIVLDTNVVSELMRAAPAANVVAWVHEQPAVEMYTTSVTVAEVRYGIARLPAGRRQDLLRAAADDVFGAFADQVLAFENCQSVALRALTKLTATATVMPWVRPSPARRQAKSTSASSLPG